MFDTYYCAEKDFLLNTVVFQKMFRRKSSWIFHISNLIFKEHRNWREKILAYMYVVVLLCSTI